MILDTNAVSALSREDGGLVRVLEASTRHHLPTIVIGEYEFGLSSFRRDSQLRVWLELLIAESVVLSVDRETASHYGLLCADLKRRGRPTPSNDIWIAALAIQHGLPIVSRDQHFDAMPSIKRVGW